MPDHDRHPLAPASTSRRGPAPLPIGARLLRSSFLALAVSHASLASAERASDGEIDIAFWQAPDLLNPYVSGGRKDVEAASLVLEPLARYDDRGRLVPWLVDALPTTANGGIAADRTAVTWRIAEGLTWSDGSPFTSADVKFTYDFCTHQDGTCAQRTRFQGVVDVQTPDDLTVIVQFSGPTANPFGPFVGGESPILQAAQFSECLAAGPLSCTAQNMAPVGTGPFVILPDRLDGTVRMIANQAYRDPLKPAFASVTLSTISNATAAARAIMAEDGADYAWNLQLSPGVLGDLQQSARATPVASFGPLVERIAINHTNPDPALGPDERSVIAPHPILGDARVVRAMSLALDRSLLVEIGFGAFGKVGCHWIPAPAEFVSSNTEGCLQDLDAARALLDEAGWSDLDRDGIREKDGRRLSLILLTSTNSVRQDFQSLIRLWWGQIGIETEARNVTATELFGGEVNSSQTAQRFYADALLYADTFTGTDPEAHLASALCTKIPTPDRQWQGENISRVCWPDYDALHAELRATSDPEARARLIKQLNDIMIARGGMIPLVHRARLSGFRNTLGGVRMNAWGSEFWNIADWHRRE